MLLQTSSLRHLTCWCWYGHAKPISLWRCHFTARGRWCQWQLRKIGTGRLEPAFENFVTTVHVLLPWNASQLSRFPAQICGQYMMISFSSSKFFEFEQGKRQNANFKCSNMTQFPKNYMKFEKKVFDALVDGGLKVYNEATVVMWLPSGSTWVAPENASHSYQLSHHSWHSKQLRWIECHSWWDSWYSCEAFSGATLVTWW